MTLLWQGHEVDCYTVLGGTTATEEASAADTGYERTAMRAGRSEAAAQIVSSPDWPAVDEFWQRFNYNSQTWVVAFILWSARNAAGVDMVRITAEASTNNAVLSVWNGATYDNIATFPLVATSTKGRFDIHFKGGAAGQIEVWHGPSVNRTKIIDVAGDYSAAVGIVRIFHQGCPRGGGWSSWVGHEIVQTTSTLNTTSESEPPTSNGIDVGGVGTFANVDEAINSDADLVTLTAGQKQSFKGAARAWTQGVVTGVTASCRAWYEAGGSSQIKAYLVIGGVRYYSPAINLALTAAGYQYTWELNPATGLAWTPAQANDAALEWGWEAQ